MDTRYYYYNSNSLDTYNLYRVIDDTMYAYRGTEVGWGFSGAWYNDNTHNKHMQQISERLANLIIKLNLWAGWLK